MKIPVVGLFNIIHFFKILAGLMTAGAAALLVALVVMLIVKALKDRKLPQRASERYGDDICLALGKEDHRVKNTEVRMKILAVNGEEPLATTDRCYLPLGEVTLVVYIQRYDPEGTYSDGLFRGPRHTFSAKARDRVEKRMAELRQERLRDVRAGRLPDDCIAVEFTAKPRVVYCLRPDPDTGAAILSYEGQEEHGTLKFFPARSSEKEA